MFFQHLPNKNLMTVNRNTTLHSSALDKGQFSANARLLLGKVCAKAGLRQQMRCNLRIFGIWVVIKKQNNDEIVGVDFKNPGCISVVT